MTRPPLPRKIKAVVFDLDGLMIDSEKLFYRVGQCLLERRGKQFSDELMRQMLGRPPRDAYGNLIAAQGLTESVEELAQEGQRLFFQMMPDGLQLMPGLMRVLEVLEHIGLPLAVATSSSRPYTERVLDQFDLRGRFRFLLTCEDVPRGKPDPEIYRQAAERFPVPPGQMLVLEDSPVGMQAAKAAGAVCAVVPSPYTPQADWSPADLVVQRLDSPQLLNFIAQAAGC